MTYKEYALVMLVITLGLIPGFLAYRYLSTNTAVFAFLEERIGGVSQSGLVPIVFSDRKPVQETGDAFNAVYYSGPQKESDGLCVNSYYMSFALAFSKDDTFSLTKQCESVRDNSMSWYGVASTTDNLSEKTRVLHILGDEAGPYAEPLQITLALTGEELVVEETTLTEIGTTTTFASLRAPTEVISAETVDTNMIESEEVETPSDQEAL